MEMAERYGDIVYFGSWRTPIFFVNHPNLVREVLVTRTQDFVRADAVRNALRLFDGERIAHPCARLALVDHCRHET